MRVTSLNEGWQFRPDGPWQIHSFGPFQKELGWLPAQLPGCVHLDLVACGVISDPLKGYGDVGCAWVDHTDWLYRRVLVLSKLETGFRRVLRFGCLDTVCSIWVDGSKVAEHDNYFLPFELDLTHLEAGSHELEVRFESPFRVGNARRAAYFAKEGLPEDTKHFDARCFLRKPLYQFGWDWGPVLPSCGFRDTVELLEFETRILSFDVFTEKLTGDRWRAWSQTEIDGLATMRTTYDGNEHVGDFEIEVVSPELWWPNGMGKPALYHAAAQVASGHRTRRLIGFRTIELLRERDEIGESFSFAVNGVPIFARGANWIPNAVWEDLDSPASEENRFALFNGQLGANMIRVWGGGLYESDQFYEDCDHQGILVWQDFPFACFYAPDDEENRAIIRREAEVQVKRLSNHPCLALLCGNNEVHQMHQQKWAGEISRFFGEAIFEQDLREIVQNNAPNIPYVSTSPIGENPSGEPDPAGQTTINMGGWGDQHYWDVWHGRGDWIHYQDAYGRFSSEFGFASAPCPRLFCDAIRDLETLWHHDRTGKVRGTLESLVELHYPKATNEIEWIYSSQLNQRDAMRFAIEHFRTCGFCSGSLVWQLNDCWPAQSWALQDSYGDLKLAGAELKRLYAPVLVCPQLTGENLLMKIVADSRSIPTFGAEVEFFNVDGRTVHSESLRVRVEAGEHEARCIPVPTRVESGAEISIRAGSPRWIEIPIPPSLLASACYFRTRIPQLRGNSTTRLLAEPKHMNMPRPRVSFHETESKTSNRAVDVRVEGALVDALILETENGKPIGNRVAPWHALSFENGTLPIQAHPMRKLAVLLFNDGEYHLVHE